MKYFRMSVLVILNLVVFTICWVLFGSLAETLIHKYMSDTITLPAAFAWGAINFLVARFISLGIESGVEWIVWGKAE